MDLIASFSAHKIKTSHFLTVDGILKDDEEEKKVTFKNILKDEITAQGIAPRTKPLLAANNQIVTTYPCVSHGVSIEGTSESDFYFDFSLQDVSLPILGTSFTDDCAYTHSINGNLTITGMRRNAGAGYYIGCKVLDFDVVMTKFNMIRSR